MIGGTIARRRQRDDDHENPAWPALVDLFAFGMVVMLLLWVQALPEPPKPPPPRPSPWETGFIEIKTKFPGVVWDGESSVMRIDRFQGQEIFFDSGSFDFDPSDRAVIAAVARELSTLLESLPKVVVVVKGTADPNRLSQATPPRDNVQLSALRAAEVSRALVDAGLQRQLQVVGLGETGEKGKSPEEMREYRRVFLELHWVESVVKAGAQS